MGLLHKSWQALKLYDNAQSIYCLAYHACQSSKLNGILNIYGFGYKSIQSSTINSRDGTIMSIYIDSVDALTSIINEMTLFVYIHNVRLAWHLVYINWYWLRLRFVPKQYCKYCIVPNLAFQL